MRQYMGDKTLVKHSLSDSTVAILSREIMNLDIVLSTISFDTFNKVNWSHGSQNNLNFSYFPPPRITAGLSLCHIY